MWPTTCLYVFVCGLLCPPTCIYTCLYAYLCVNMYLCFNMCLHTCVNMCTAWIYPCTYVCVYLQQSPCSCHNNLQIARTQYWTYISIELVVRSKILQKFPNMVVEEAGADILLVKNRPVQTIDWSTGAGVYTWLVKRGRCIYLIGQKGPVYIFNWSTGAGADISLVNRVWCVQSRAF